VYATYSKVAVLKNGAGGRSQESDVEGTVVVLVLSGAVTVDSGSECGVDEVEARQKGVWSMVGQWELRKG
jgi:hypothetical protein